jgi:hypothetical protein
MQRFKDCIPDLTVLGSSNKERNRRGKWHVEGRGYSFEGGGAKLEGKRKLGTSRIA